MVPVKINFPTPDFVKLAALAPLLMMPLMVLVLALVRLRVPCNLIAAAVNTSVVNVMLPKAATPPTAPVKVMSPVPVLMVNALPATLAFKVEPK